MCPQLVEYLSSGEYNASDVLSISERMIASDFTHFDAWNLRGLAYLQLASRPSPPRLSTLQSASSARLLEASVACMHAAVRTSIDTKNPTPPHLPARPSLEELATVPSFVWGNLAEATRLRGDANASIGYLVLSMLLDLSNVDAFKQALSLADIPYVQPFAQVMAQHWVSTRSPVLFSDASPIPDILADHAMRVHLTQGSFSYSSDSH